MNVIIKLYITNYPWYTRWLQYWQVYQRYGYGGLPVVRFAVALTAVVELAVELHLMLYYPDQWESRSSSQNQPTLSQVLI